MNNFDVMVIRLEGFLEALGAIDGAVRSRIFSAFSIDKRDGFDISKLVMAVFECDDTLKISSIEKVTQWERFLEDTLAQVVMDDLLGLKCSADTEQMLERKADISFRIMDMISFALDGEKSEVLYDISAFFESAKSNARFFAIQLDTRYLVLQFAYR